MLPLNNFSFCFEPAKCASSMIFFVRVLARAERPDNANWPFVSAKQPVTSQKQDKTFLNQF